MHPTGCGAQQLFCKLVLVTIFQSFYFFLRFKKSRKEQNIVYLVYVTNQMTYVTSTKRTQVRHLVFSQRMKFPESFPVANNSSARGDAFNLPSVNIVVLQNWKK